MGTTFDDAGDPVAVDLNLDAALLLQRLAGIDGYPEVLEIWPTIWEVADQERVDAVVFDQLTAAGILAEGRIDPQVEQWLETLYRPDVELAARIWDPSPEPDPEAMLRMSLVRAGTSQVLGVRHGDHVVLQSVYSADQRLDLLSTALLAALGPGPALAFDPLRVSRAQLDELPEDATGRRQALLELGATPRTAGLLSRVLFEVQRHAEVTITEYHDGTAPAAYLDFGELAGLDEAPTFDELRELIGDRAPQCVHVLDTPSGRIVVSPSAAADGAAWVNYLPGDDAAVHAGIRALVELLPGGSWFGTSRV